MADTAKRLGGPDDIPNSEVTLYTVPGATTAILRITSASLTNSRPLRLTQGVR